VEARKQPWKSLFKIEDARKPPVPGAVPPSRPGVTTKV